MGIHNFSKDIGEAETQGRDLSTPTAHCVERKCMLVHYHLVEANLHGDPPDNVRTPICSISVVAVSEI